MADSKGGGDIIHAKLSFTKSIKTFQEPRQHFPSEELVRKSLRPAWRLPEIRPEQGD